MTRTLIGILLNHMAGKFKIVLKKGTQNKAFDKNGKLMPREKALKFGLKNLKPYELLAILLGTGSKGKPVLEFSQEILKKYELDRFQSLSIEELTQIPGISTAKACKILASIEFSRQIWQIENEPLAQVLNDQDAAGLFSNIKDYKKEVLSVLYLNATSQVIHQEIISVGTLDSVLIHPREVFEVALRYLAGFIIIAHNHPSGNLEPSEMDLLLTKKLFLAGQIMGIELLDSLIITSRGFLSIKNQALD